MSSRVRAETVEEGYDLKAEFASMALEPLGLQNLKIGFFNAFGDERLYRIAKPGAAS